MKQIFTFRISAQDTGARLDKFVAQECQELISRSRLKALILEGQVKIDEAIVSHPSKKLKAHQEITITIPEIREAIPAAQSIPLNIVYEDDDVIVIDKAAGMVVHPAPGNRDNTLVNALLAHCGESLSGIGGIRRPGIVHRLDKETSGLLVVAKHDLAHQRLSEQFAARSLSRRYYAVVWGVPLPPEGTVEGNIGRSPRNRKKMAVLSEGGKPARTFYKLVSAYQRVAALIDCKLESGRTHQIRVHMTAQGYPLIGDVLYGRIPRTLNPQISAFVKTFGSTPSRHALHAYQLEFIHPLTSALMRFQSNLPEDLENLLLFLKKI